MPNILVRNLDEGVVKRLKERAKSQGRSLQSEVKMILQQAADEPKLDHAAALKLADEIRSRLGGRVLSDSAELIREDRDR
jgi:plasmid stability protein